MVVNSTSGAPFIVNDFKWLFPYTYNSINSMVGMYNNGLTNCLGINNSNPLFNLDLYGNLQASTDIVAQKEIIGSYLIIGNRLLKRNYGGAVGASSFNTEIEIVDSSGKIDWRLIKNKPDISSGSSTSALAGIGLGLSSLFLSASTLGLVYRNSLGIDSIADVLRVNPLDASKIQIGYAWEQGLNEFFKNRAAAGNNARIWTTTGNPLAI
jgi:hypothetical protein